MSNNKNGKNDKNGKKVKTPKDPAAPKKPRKPRELDYTTELVTRKVPYNGKEMNVEMRLVTYKDQTAEFAIGKEGLEEMRVWLKAQRGDTSSAPKTTRTRGALGSTLTALHARIVDTLAYKKSAVTEEESAALLGIKELIEKVKDGFPVLKRKAKDE